MKMHYPIPVLETRLLKSRSWHVTFGFQSCPARSVAADANLYRLVGPEQGLGDKSWTK